MIDKSASPVELRKQVQGFILCVAALLLVWGASRLVAASDSMVFATAIGVPFGVCGGYLGAKAEAGAPILILAKRWWWAVVFVVAGIAAFDPVNSNRFLLAAMSGSMFVSYLFSFVFFHLKLTQR